MKLVDTNILIYLLRYQPEYLKIRFAKEINEGLFISSVTLAELRKGIELSKKREQTEQALSEIVSLLIVIPFGEKEAGEYGRIWASLRKNGYTVGEFDIMIAATAAVHDLPLVTNNTKDFRNIPGIVLEDWLIR